MNTSFVSFNKGNKEKKVIVTQTLYGSIERFFQFHTLLFLEIDAKLICLFLFNFETIPCKNITDSYKKHSGQKLDQFQPIGLEIL